VRVGAHPALALRRDAAGRGLKVLLVEQNDLASATSSASTKLIHGGLRYLEYFEFRLVAEAARALGPAYDVEIVEVHHRMKRDAPSGTALRLAEVAAGALGLPEKDAFVCQRQGETGARRAGTLGIQALRGGDVVGDHTVHFLADGERLELTHRATSRDNFARGALRAARWLVGKKPGFYGMQDVLGFPT